MRKRMYYIRVFSSKRKIIFRGYKPIMPQIVKALFLKELQETKARIIEENGNFVYRPSKNYLQLFELFNKQRKSHERKIRI